MGNLGALAGVSARGSHHESGEEHVFARHHDGGVVFRSCVGRDDRKWRERTKDGEKYSFLPSGIEDPTDRHIIGHDERKSTHQSVYLWSPSVTEFIHIITSMRD